MSLQVERWEGSTKNNGCNSYGLACGAATKKHENTARAALFRRMRMFDTCKSIEPLPSTSYIRNAHWSCLRYVEEK